METISCLSLFQCLEHAYTQTKYWHQQTDSYAEHMALGAFYEGLSPLADNFMETYMGIYGKENATEPFGMKFKPYSEGCCNSYMESFHKKVMKCSEEIKESCLKNILDEITALTAKTNYLLTLK